MVDGYTSQETIGVQKLVGKYGRFSHVHTRFSSQEPPTTGILAFQEFIASAGANDQAYDDKARARLRQLSEELIGEAVRIYKGTGVLYGIQGV
jgi:hypothetical protein